MPHACRSPWALDGKSGRMQFCWSMPKNDTWHDSLAVGSAGSLVLSHSFQPNLTKEFLHHVKVRLLLSLRHTTQPDSHLGPGLGQSACCSPQRSPKSRTSATNSTSLHQRPHLDMSEKQMHEPVVGSSEQWYVSKNSSINRVSHPVLPWTTPFKSGHLGLFRLITRTASTNGTARGSFARRWWLYDAGNCTMFVGSWLGSTHFPQRFITVHHFVHLALILSSVYE